MNESDVEQLYRQLAATAELPVDRRASRLLGEAEAIADDMRDCEPDVVTERAGVVLKLLEQIDGTDHAGADERVEDARRIAVRLAEA